MKSRLPLLATVLVTVTAGWYYLLLPATGAQLGQRQLRLSSSEIGATADYRLSFNLATAGTLGSIELEFCSNDPFPTTTCTAPVGMDVTGATLTTQTGPTGFSIAPGATANRLVLTRLPAAASVGAARYEFSGVVNPSSPGSYYLRLQTFASDDATGPASDYGGLAFATTNLLAVSVEVPPYLIFCTAITIGNLNCANSSGDAINFGELSSSRASTGSSQMLVATNAEDGYSITAHGTTLSSGSNIINALSAPDVSRPGTGQFGLNLRANTAPPGGSEPTGPGVSQPLPNYNQPNIFRFVTGDTVAARPEPENVRVFTVSYLVNVPANQAAGVYVSTITYVCLADF